MNKFQRLSILARAAARMSPRMAIYMVRRIARNRLVPRFAQAYRNRLAGIQASLPKLRATPEEISPGLVAMAEFYAAEYRDMIDGAAEGPGAIAGGDTGSVQAAGSMGDDQPVPSEQTATTNDGTMKAGE